MDQPQSGRPASASRPARRSLIEFSLPASRAPEELSSAASPLPTMQKDKQPFKPSHQKMEKPTSAPLDADHDIAASRSWLVSREGASNGPPTAAKVAAEYRAKTFELMIANINSTLEYTHRLVNVKTPT